MIVILIGVLAVLVLLLGLTWAVKRNGNKAGSMMAAAPKTADDVQWIDRPYPDGHHGLASPASALLMLTKQLGKPDVLDPRPGGLAVWNQQSLRSRGYYFDRIELRDEQIPHDDHVDFLYGYLDIDVAPHLVSEVRKLSGSAEYDPVAKRFRMRCDDLAVLLVTFIMVKRIATKQIRGEDARAMLKPWIIALKNSKDPGDFKAYMYELGKYKDSLQYFDDDTLHHAEYFR